MESNFDPSGSESSKGNEEETNVADELVKVSADELFGKFRSKAAIYNFFALKCQFYLPPYE